MGRYPAAATALRRVNLREHDAEAPPAANTKKILQNILDTTSESFSVVPTPLDGLGRKDSRVNHSEDLSANILDGPMDSRSERGI